MIDPGEITWTGKKGDVVCRPSDWKDVLKFFLINYALHALTVVTLPGSGSITTVCSCLTAIILPFVGLLGAVGFATDLAITGKNSLEKAKFAGALVMVVPKNRGFTQDICRPSFTNIHGQHPFRVQTLANPFSKAFWASRASRGISGTLDDPEDSFNTRFNSTYYLATVPETYKVEPLVGGAKSDFELSSNYGIVRSLAAIVQLAYGAYELYVARANQFDKFGYAAYSLTIIPYVLMSLVNLAASASRPSYPAMYIVYYRGMDIPDAPPIEAQVPPINKSISAEEDSLLSASENIIGHREDWMKEVESVVAGHVGYTYGDLRASSPDSPLQGLVILAAIIGATALPYLVIYAFTGFQNGESTISQRSWVLVATTWGQLAPFILISCLDRVADLIQRLSSLASPREFDVLLLSLLLSAPTVGMFVIVARMILQDQICTEI